MLAAAPGRRTRLIDNVPLEEGDRDEPSPERQAAAPRARGDEAAGEKIVMVTAYDAPGARFAEDAGVDVDPRGRLRRDGVLGHEGTTVPVTVDEMLMLTRTVARAAPRPLVVADMPFGSFQVSDEEAVENAMRFVKEARRDAVKLEGAARCCRACAPSSTPGSR